MATIRGYHRPTSVSAALDLLARPDVISVPLAGGTSLNASAAHGADEVVDLQAVGLATITDGAVLEIGSMVTLRQLIDHPATPPLLRDLAHREAPNTIRNAATVGGAVATAHPESGFVAALLASGAEVAVTTSAGDAQMPVMEFLDGFDLNGGLITAIRVEVGGSSAFEFAARTPADIPIVLVAGHRTEGGVLRLAATGVGATPRLIDPNAVDELDPPADFRGSSEYRREVVGVLTGRVLARLGGGS